jgi:hypothetical protein
MREIKDFLSLPSAGASVLDRNAKSKAAAEQGASNQKSY